MLIQSSYYYKRVLLSILHISIASLNKPTVMTQLVIHAHVSPLRKMGPSILGTLQFHPPPWKKYFQGGGWADVFIFNFIYLPQGRNHSGVGEREKANTKITIWHHNNLSQEGESSCLDSDCNQMLQKKPPLAVTPRWRTFYPHPLITPLRKKRSC